MPAGFRRHNRMGRPLSQGITSLQPPAGRAARTEAIPATMG
jgi:hypothetical protein